MVPIALPPIVIVLLDVPVPILIPPVCPAAFPILIVVVNAAVDELFPIVIDPQVILVPRLRIPVAAIGFA